ncbi:hypothetical protein ACTJIJ_19870 [Niabella sp. 22666]|uniref:hypothetical protein n=1 Tax=Niabella sp. 22666 TaxID=3453954 RepID=UPI003F871ED1
MNTDRIHNDFERLIFQRGIYKELRLTAADVKAMRRSVRRGTGITIDKKLRVLQRSGWRQDAVVFTQADMVAFGKFVIESGASAKELGAAYLFEKWQNKGLVNQ